MPITKAAKKADKRSKKLRERNLKVKNAMKEAVKTFNKTLVTDGDNKDISQLAIDAQSKIDKAVKLNIIHQNTAARKKSSIARKVNKA